jgi:hypothetical protein
MPLDTSITPAELAREIAKVRAKEAAQKAHRERQLARTSGVCFGGMTAEPWVDLTEDEIEEEARRRIIRHRAYLAENPDVAARIAAARSAQPAKAA